MFAFSKAFKNPGFELQIEDDASQFRVPAPAATSADAAVTSLEAPGVGGAGYMDVNVVAAL